jgi:hypothetical protein
MAKNRYDKYFHIEPLREISTQPLLKGLEMFDVLGANWNADCTVHFSAVNKPLLLLKEPHVHTFAEFVCFIGGDPQKARDFGAEVEMFMGKEQEKHIITKSTVVYLPPGFPHCPLEFKVVRKPVILMTISLTKEYRQDTTKTK